MQYYYYFIIFFPFSISDAGFTCYSALESCMCVCADKQYRWTTCFGYIRPSSGALDVELQHMVFGTELLDGWWSWELLRRSCCTMRMVPCNTTYAAPLKTIIHPKTRCRKPYAAAQHLMLPVMGVCTRNMSIWEYINKITLLHQVGISSYFMRKMHGQTTLKFTSFLCF